MRAGISQPTRAVRMSVSHICAICVYVHADPTVLPSGTEIMARMMQASSQQRIYETPKEGRVSHASRINYLRVACVYHSLYIVWHCAPVYDLRYRLQHTYLILIPHSPAVTILHVRSEVTGYSSGTAVEKEKTMRKSDMYIERM